MEAKRQLKTTLPPLLSQYLPDNAKGEDSSHLEKKSETPTTDDDRKSPKKTKTDTTRPQKPGPGRQEGRGRSGRHTPGLSREGTSTSIRSSSRKKQEAEHHEHVANVWEQAKSEVLQERHAVLQEKLLLQQRLVRAQDRLAEVKRQEEQERIVQRRQEEKQKRQARESALQDICRQSLDEDRKKAVAEQKARRKTGPPQAPPTPLSDAESDDSSRGSKPRRHPGYRPSMALPPHQLSSSPMRELEDEREAEEVQGENQGQGQDVPWHHAQLYQLYGQQADYFLHPKPPVTEQRRMTHPKLKHQKGHIGAGELWDTLRKDSTTKLLRNDQRFPQELKAAFSAFVRERLQLKHCRPVERSFCATKDVPDIERLMDQSKLRKVRLYRHKTELMYRSSLNNKDRTDILVHNNPMPDVTESGQTESISRYLPSWVDDESEVSEADYMKWINRRQQKESGDRDGLTEEEGEEGGEREEKNPRHSAQSRQLSESTKELQSIWQAISTRRQPPKTPRYKFLTEKEAESEGGFSQKFQEERENRDKLQPYSGLLPFKSHSAMELSNPNSQLSGPESRERGQSARSEMLHRFRSEWQPLSMNALVEYKKQMETMGEGEFDHGRMKMWPVVSFS